MTTVDSVEYFIGDELESLRLWWTANGALVDFSVAHTYSSKLVLASDTGVTPTALFTKTTGFTGAAGSGVKPTGVPNLVIDWATTGELNAPTASGLYVFQVVATRTSDSKQRTGNVNLNLRARY